MKEPLFPIVILAGGLAKRLRPMTEMLPKALIQINHEPFIFHQLRLLKQQGIRDVILCVGFLGEKIERIVGDGRQFGLHVRYSYDGDVLLGTGGAIKKALPMIGEIFFVLYGDSYLDCDYAAVQEAFKKQQKLGLMTVFHNLDQWDNSNIEYADNQILAYDKNKRTPLMRYIDYGLGVFCRQAFNNVPENEAYDLALLYKKLLNDHALGAYEVKKRFYEIGSFTGIKELEYHLSPKLV